MPATAIKVTDLRKTYSRGGEKLKVLDGVNLEIQEGEFLALTGPSGSGKSTILNFLGGLDRPDSGQVMIGGAELTDMGNDELAHWRSSNVGFIFQAFNLIPVLSARENVELPLLLQPLSRPSARNTRNMLWNWLA